MRIYDTYIVFVNTPDSFLMYYVIWVYCTSYTCTFVLQYNFAENNFIEHRGIPRTSQNTGGSALINLGSVVADSDLEWFEFVKVF